MVGFFKLPFIPPHGCDFRENPIIYLPVLSSPLREERLVHWERGEFASPVSHARKSEYISSFVSFSRSVQSARLAHVLLSFVAASTSEESRFGDSFVDTAILLLLFACQFLILCAD